jgi:hypothetical protein
MNRKSLTTILSLLLGLAAVVAVAIGFATPQRTAQAQSTLLLEENFDYGATPGNLVAVSAGNWVSHSGTTGPVLYITASLSMPKYGSSGIGGAAVISTTGVEDVWRSFITQTSGTVYYAALVQVVTATTTGDYFLHFMGTESTPSTVLAFTPKMLMETCVSDWAPRVRPLQPLPTTHPTISVTVRLTW